MKKRAFAEKGGSPSREGRGRGVVAYTAGREIFPKEQLRMWARRRLWPNVIRYHRDFFGACVHLRARGVGLNLKLCYLSLIILNRK
jgi:hypothetical protein